jgi:hypothetical protein
MSAKINGGAHEPTLTSYTEPNPFLEEETHPMRKSNESDIDDGGSVEVLWRIERQLDSQRRVIENRPEPKSQATVIIGAAVAVLLAVLAVGGYLISITRFVDLQAQDIAVLKIQRENLQKEKDALERRVEAVEKDNKILNQLSLMKFGKPIIPAQ